MLIGDALFNSSFDMIFFAIYNSARKDTLFFRDVQEKSLFRAIFLVWGIKAATKSQFRGRSWGELQFKV